MLSNRQENLLSSEMLIMNDSYDHGVFVRNVVGKEFVCDNYNYVRDDDYYKNADIYNKKGGLILSLKNLTSYNEFLKLTNKITVSINGHDIDILSQQRTINNPKVVISDYCPKEFIVIVMAVFEGKMNHSLNLKPFGNARNIRKNQAQIDENIHIAFWFLQDVLRRFAASVDTRFTFC